MEGGNIVCRNTGKDPAFQPRKGCGLLALNLGQILGYLGIYTHFKIRSKFIVYQSQFGS